MSCQTDGQIKVYKITFARTVIKSLVFLWELSTLTSLWLDQLLAHQSNQNEMFLQNVLIWKGLWETGGFIVLWCSGWFFFYCGLSSFQILTKLCLCSELIHLLPHYHPHPLGKIMNEAPEEEILMIFPYFLPLLNIYSKSCQILNKLLNEDLLTYIAQIHHLVPNILWQLFGFPKEWRCWKGINQVLRKAVIAVYIRSVLNRLINSLIVCVPHAQSICGSEKSGWVFRDQRVKPASKC